MGKTGPQRAAEHKRKRTGLKVLCVIVAAIVLFFAAINVIPPKKVMETNPFVKAADALPMIAAHRGGGVSNPENTLMAYRAAVNEYRIDICESDLWMTADGHLVYNHDPDINRTACPEGAETVTIAEHTLDELREYNMGYNFLDSESGEYIYRDLPDAEQKELGLKILEFHELLEEFYDTRKDLLFIIEIKNGGEAGFAAADIIDRTLTERFPDYKSNFVIGTFHPEIEEYLQEKHPSLLRGASTSGAANFVVTQLFRVNLFSNVDFACLQIPMGYTLKGVHLDLTKKTYLTRAHKRNIAVQYWTINDPDEMRLLIELGADAIMTDDPLLLKQVLAEYGG